MAVFSGFFILQPVMAAVDGDTVLDTSAVSAGAVTIDTTLPLAFTFPPNGSTIRSANIFVEGRTDPFQVVSIKDNFDTPLGSARADPSGRFVFTPDTGFTNGKHVLTATAEDAAGNISADVLTFYIDVSKILQGWFVSPAEGSDTNSGDTTAAPFRTVDRAFQVMRSGDNVYLMPGVHEPETFFISPEKSGSVFKNTVISALPGAEGRVYIKCRPGGFFEDQGNGFVFDPGGFGISNVKYLEFRGIVFFGSGLGGLINFAKSTHIDLVNNRFKDADAGLTFSECQNVRLYNNLFENFTGGVVTLFSIDTFLFSANTVFNSAQALAESPIPGRVSNRLYIFNNFEDVTQPSFVGLPDGVAFENYERFTDGTVREGTGLRTAPNDTALLMENIDLDGDDKLDSGKISFFNSVFDAFDPFKGEPPPTPLFTWYVSPNGSDAFPGNSPSQPFKTIGRVFEVARSMDTVYLLPGVFQPGEFSFPDTLNGTFPHPTLFAAAPGFEGQVRIKSPPQGFVFDGSHDLTIRGIEFFGGNRVDQLVHVKRSRRVDFINDKFSGNTTPGIGIRVSRFERLGGGEIRSARIRFYNNTIQDFARWSIFLEGAEKIQIVSNQITSTDDPVVGNAPGSLIAYNNFEDVGGVNADEIRTLSTLLLNYVRTKTGVVLTLPDGGSVPVFNDTSLISADIDLDGDETGDSGRISYFVGVYDAYNPFANQPPVISNVLMNSQFPIDGVSLNAIHHIRWDVRDADRSLLRAVEIQIDDDPDFSSPEFSEVFRGMDLPNEIFFDPPPNVTGHVFLRIRGSDPSEFGPYTSSQTGFTLTTAPPLFQVPPSPIDVVGNTRPDATADVTSPVPLRSSLVGFRFDTTGHDPFSVVLTAPEGATAAATAEQPYLEASMILDGVLDDGGNRTSWEAPFGVGGAEITVDLGRSVSLNGVLLFNARNTAGTKDFTLFISADGVNFERVGSGVLPQDALTVPLEVNFPDRPVRLVRLRADSFYGFAAALGEMMFRTSDPQEQSKYNVALSLRGAKATASHIRSFANPAENVIDGLLSATPEKNAEWLAPDFFSGAYVTVELPKPYITDRVRLFNAPSDTNHNDGRGTRDFTLMVSEDGAQFDVVNRGILDRGTFNVPDLPPHDVRFQPRLVKFIRFRADSFYGGGAGLGELQVFPLVTGDFRPVSETVPLGADQLRLVVRQIPFDTFSALGRLKVQFVAFDEAGNFAVSPTEVFRIYPATPPAAPVLDPLPVGTSLPKVNVSGFVDEFTTSVELFRNGAGVRSLNFDPGGRFRFDLVDLAEGTNEFFAVATGKNGQKSAASNTVSVVHAPDTATAAPRTLAPLEQVTPADQAIVRVTTLDGDAVEIFGPSGLLHRIDPSPAGSYFVSIPMALGVNDIHAVFTDPAGASAVSSVVHVYRDNFAPSPVDFNPKISEAYNTIVIKGVAPAGSRLRLTLDGVLASETALPGSSPLFAHVEDDVHVKNDLEPVPGNPGALRLAGGATQGDVQLTISRSKIFDRILNFAPVSRPGDGRIIYEYFDPAAIPDITSLPNLALHKMVTASDYESDPDDLFGVRPPENVVGGVIRYPDGSIEHLGMWSLPISSPDRSTPVSVDSGWVQIDLGAVQEIGMILVANAADEDFGVRTKAWRMAVSATGEFSGEETEIARGEFPDEFNSNFHQVNFPTIQTRFVRFFVDSHYDNAGGLEEIEVYAPFQSGLFVEFDPAEFPARANEILATDDLSIRIRLERAAASQASPELDRVELDVAHDFDLGQYVLSEGTHHVTITAEDDGGNSSAVVDSDVIIDYMPPATTVQLENQNIILRFTATDTLSGIARTMVSLFPPYTSFFDVAFNNFILSAPGIPFTIKFFSVDRAGNIEATHTVFFDTVVELLRPAQTAFSPNDDGRNDALNLTFHTRERNGFQYEVSSSVVDPINGDVILSLESFVATGEDTFQIAWDGKDQTGRTLPDGDYAVRVTVRHPLYKDPIVLTTPVKIDLQAPGAPTLDTLPAETDSPTVTVSGTAEFGNSVTILRNGETVAQATANELFPTGGVIFTFDDGPQGWAFLAEDFFRSNFGSRFANENGWMVAETVPTAYQFEFQLNPATQASIIPDLHRIFRMRLKTTGYTRTRLLIAPPFFTGSNFIPLQPDGQFHTIVIDLSTVPFYSGLQPVGIVKVEFGGSGGAGTGSVAIDQIEFISVSKDTGVFVASDIHLTPGVNTFTAIARDPGGNFSPVSDPVSVEFRGTADTEPPTLTIAPVQSPTNQNVTLTIQAADNVTPPERIVITGDASPYTTEGAYNVTIIATDEAGNTSTAAVSFVIDKTPPDFVRFAPAGGETFAARRDTLVVSIEAKDGVDPFPTVFAQLVHFVENTSDTAITVVDGRQIDPLSIPAGQWKLAATAKDVAGNIRTREGGFFTVIHDALPPRTALTVGDPNFVRISDSATYVTAATPLTFTAVDDLVTVGDSAGFGVAKTEASVDNGAYAAVTGPVTLSGLGAGVEGRHTISYRSTDTAGNVEAARLSILYIDATAPSTADTKAPAPNSNGWNPADVTATFSATDPALSDGSNSGSGVRETRVGVDSATPATSTTAILTSEGIHTLAFFSVDNIGNTESLKSDTVRIDKTGPVVTATRSPAAGAGGWNKTAVAVSYSATDTLSGIDIPASDLATDTLSTEGAGQSASGFALDLAGNKTTATITGINIDLTAPVTQLTIGDPKIISGQTYVRDSTPFTLTATDALSGVSKTEFRLDSGAFKIGTAFTISTEGSHTIGFRSTDTAGNVETEKTAQVFVDTTPPESTLNLDGSKFLSDSPVQDSVSTSGISFNRRQAQMVLELVNTVTFRVLNDEVKLASDAAKNIVAARPITSIIALDNVSQVGSATLTTLRGFTDTYETIIRPGGEVVKGVAFAPKQRAIILGFVNRAISKELQLVNQIGATTADSIIASRPYPDLGKLAATSTSAVIKNLSTYTVGLASTADTDGDGIKDASDNCPYDSNVTQSDVDGDGIGDFCDASHMSDGILFALTEAQGVLNVANTYSQDSLVAISGMDAAKAQSVVAARPVGTLAALANISGIDTLTIRRLRLAVSGEQTPSENLVYVSSTTTLRVTAEDAGAGVDKIKTKLDAGTFDEIASRQAPTETQHILLYQSIDKLANVEVPEAFVFMVDTSRPTLTVTVNGKQAKNMSGTLITAAATTFTAVTSDPPIKNFSGSGIKLLRRTLDGTPTETSGATLTVSMPAEGSHAIQFHAEDNVANGADSAFNFIVDASGPQVTIRSPSAGAVFIARRDSIVIDATAADLDPAPVVTMYLRDEEEGNTVPVAQGQKIEPLSIDDGKWSFVVVATDWVGNRTQTETGPFEVIHDIQPPRTTLTVGDPKFVQVSTYVSSATPLTFSAVDDLVTVGDSQGLGVSKIEVAVDSGAFTTVTGPVTLAGLGAVAEGKHTVSYKATDVIGNVESVRLSILYIDATAPVTTQSQSPAANVAGWNNADVTVTLSATDPALSDGSNSGSGVKETRLGVDTTPTAYTSARTIASEGVHGLAFFSVDNIGNTETTRAGTVKIDKTAPVTNLTIGSPKVVDVQTFVTSGTPFNLSATDTLSGVARTEFRLNAGAFSSGESFTIPAPEGVKTVGFRSMDVAENVETEKTTQVVLDNTPPATTLSVDITDTTGGVLIPQSEITLAAADGPALTPAVGVDRIEYSLDGGATRIYTGAFSVSAIGSHSLTYGAVDRLGNPEAAHIFNFTVAPALSAAKSVSFSPRVLVWLNDPPSPKTSEGKHEDDEDEKDKGIPDANVEVLKTALDSAPILLYTVVDNADSFVTAMRTDSYNVYVIVGDKDELAKERQWELSERVRLGDGLVSSFLNEIDLPTHDEGEREGKDDGDDHGEGKDEDHGKDDEHGDDKGGDNDHEKDNKASKNLLGVDVDGKFSDKNIKATLTSAAIPFVGDYQTTGRTQEVRALAATAVGDGFVTPKGKDTSTEPTVVSNGFGSGKTVFFAFDLGQSATPANSVSTGKLLNAALLKVTSTMEVFVPDGRTAIGIGVRSNVVPLNLAVRIEEFLPAGASVVNKLKGDIQGAVVLWNLTLGVNESDTRYYLLGLPNVGEAGVTTTADIQYLVRGNYVLFDSLKLTMLTEKDIPGLLDQAIGEVDALLVSDPPEDRNKLQDALTKLRRQRSSPPVTKDQIETDIGEILKIIRDLDGISADPQALSDLRTTLDKVVLLYERTFSR